MNLPSSQPRSLPLYIRATELLSREIAAGHWRGGERIPTEAELARTMGMAVGTVRKALAELARRGLLERKHGSGTYVRQGSGSGKVGRNSQVRSIYDFFRLELDGGGGLPTATLLDFRVVPKPAQAQALGGSLSRTWYRLRRLRWLNDVPAALEEIWFDARHRKGLQPAQLSEALYLFYKESLGFWIARVEDHVGVGVVPDWRTPPFALAAGRPCGMVSRRSWSGTDQIEEISTTWFDPALVRYTARWQ